MFSKKDIRGIPIIGVVIFLLLLSHNTFSLQSSYGETLGVSSVLGRDEKLSPLCDDFEDKGWYFDYNTHKDYRGFWHGSPRGEPELLKRVETPNGGVKGSNGALEIRTNVPEQYTDHENPDKNSIYKYHERQEDLESADFGVALTSKHQPVFLVRVWLPPFDQWGDYYSFGFRVLAYDNISGTDTGYVPSIWIKYYSKFNLARFYFRVFFGGGQFIEFPGAPIKQDGWWTLAIAFDEQGYSHFYARSGVDSLRETDEIFDGRGFLHNHGKIELSELSMDYIGHSLFSLGYEPDFIYRNSKSPKIIIDDYEVWTAR